MSESLWSFDKWRNEGRRESMKKKQIEIAERLLKIGLTAEQVIQGTELSEEEVMDIKMRLIQ